MSKIEIIGEVGYGDADIVSRVGKSDGAYTDGSPFYHVMFNFDELGDEAESAREAFIRAKKGSMPSAGTARARGIFEHTCGEDEGMLELTREIYNEDEPVSDGTKKLVGIAYITITAYEHSGMGKNLKDLMEERGVSLKLGNITVHGGTGELDEFSKKVLEKKLGLIVGEYNLKKSAEVKLRKQIEQDSASVASQL